MSGLIRQAAIPAYQSGRKVARARHPLVLILGNRAAQTAEAADESGQ
jgi:hypothetical protein